MTLSRPSELVRTNLISPLGDVLRSWRWVLAPDRTDSDRVASLSGMMTNRRAAVFATLACSAVGLCWLTGPALASPSPRAHGGVYPLPSDGWKPGDAAFTALIGGVFEAKLTPEGACAGLGSTTAFWPEGYHVRFHPTELLDPSGMIVARQGERVTAGGGVEPANYHANRCADGSQTLVIMSRVSPKGG